MSANDSSNNDMPPRAKPASLASSTRSNRSRRKQQRGHVGQGSQVGSIVNLVNTIVGAGVLAMPHALANLGIILGTIVIAWAGLTAGFGLYLQSRCARYLERGTASFFALSQMTYPKASVVFDAAIALKCFGVGVSYLIIIGDLMPGVVRGFSQDPDLPGFLFNRHFWITAFMLIAIPFTFLRRLDSLKYTSVIALIAITYLVILVVAHFGMGDTMAQRGHIKIVSWGGPIAFLSSLPVMVFAYTCHQNMFSIINEMKDNSPAKTTGVVTASIGTAFSVYTVVALTGYLSFGDNVAGNIVSQYTPSVSSTIGKAAIVILVMFSYALQVHPCRASVDAVSKWRPTNTIQRGNSSTNTSAPLINGNKNSQRPKNDEMGETRFAIITTIIIILSYMVAMTVSSLEKVLAYVGSTGSTSISFILPGLFYYKISDPDSPYHQRLVKQDDDEEERDVGTSSSDDDDGSERSLLVGMGRASILRRLSLALSIYGMLVMVVCLASNTYFDASGH